MKWVERLYDQGMNSASSTAPSGDAAAWVHGVLDWLASLDGAELEGPGKLELVGALERLKGGAAAAQARVTVSFAEAEEESFGRRGADRATARRSASAEVALARRESPHAGSRHLGLATAVVTEMPETHAALTRGDASEWAATVLVRETAAVPVEVRAEVDRRLGPQLATLTPRRLEAAARRLVAELDAAAVVARKDRAVASRRVTLRPAPDGMAYLTVLGPLRESVGAYAALKARADAVCTGQAPDELPEERGRGAVMADTALRWLSGRAVGESQSVTVNLVMTDQALFGTGDPDRSCDEPAVVPGHGPVAAATARSWCADEAAEVWLRRLYTRPGGRDLVALDSTRRLFGGGLRRFLLLRDQICRTPWCDAPIVDLDHTWRHADGGATSAANGAGLCRRCNLLKEIEGWSSTVLHDGLTDAGPPHTIEVRSPNGLWALSQAPPLLGWGWSPPEDDVLDWAAIERDHPEFFPEFAAA